MNRTFNIGALAVGLAFATPMASADTFVRMVSGPAGGSWYPLGAKMMQVMQADIPGISTSNGPGGGVGNIKDVSQGKRRSAGAMATRRTTATSAAASSTSPYKNVASSPPCIPASCRPPCRRTRASSRSPTSRARTSARENRSGPEPRSPKPC